MKRKNCLINFLKLAAFGGLTALAYAWGKDEGYDCGFKDGYKSADIETANNYEGEGNAISPSKNADCGARLASPKDFEDFKNKFMEG